MCSGGVDACTGLYLMPMYKLTAAAMVKSALIDSPSRCNS